MLLNNFIATITCISIYFVSIGQGTDCASASSITSSFGCATTSFTLTNGNSSLGSASCVSGINDDGWYQFTATDIFTTIEIINASSNIAFVAYSGTCAGLTEIGCDDQGTTSALGIFPTTIGTSYYIRIIRTSNGGGSTTGDICVTGSSTCANVVILDEQFNGPAPLIGAITGNMYGSGISNHNGAMVLSGTYFGWFNIVNGLGNVDVYDRQVNGLCVGVPVDVSFWTRESYGGTNVTYSVVDDNGATLATTTLTLTGTFQQLTFNFVATTPGLRFILHCNSTGGSGIDIVIEDLLITQCCPVIILPVELSSFDAQCTNGEVLLNWATSSEVSNDYFAIEQSADLIHFTEVGRVDGVGNSTATNNYSFRFLNQNSENEVNYFRLRQCDINGDCIYSNTIASICRIGELSVFPNPGLDEIVISGGSDRYLTAKIVSVSGQLISEKSYDFHKTNNVIILDVSRLSTGAYFLLIDDEKVKFIKE